MPKTKEQFEAIRQRSRGIILETALELFARKGYTSTSISQIAAQAGVSKGLIYNYFESKEALLHAILAAEMEVGEKWWRPIMESPDPPFEKLRKATVTVMNMIRSNLEHWKLLTSLAFQPDVLKGMEPIVADKRRIYITETIQLFTDLGVADPVKETFFYGALLDGIFFQYMNMEKEYPLDDMLEYLLQRYEGFRN